MGNESTTAHSSVVPIRGQRDTRGEIEKEESGKWQIISSTQRKCRIVPMVTVPIS